MKVYNEIKFSVSVFSSTIFFQNLQFFISTAFMTKLDTDQYFGGEGLQPFLTTCEQKWGFF
jgi:hypothetical protein